MSRIIDILSAIRNGETFDAPAMSRAEAILQSIANGTAYTDAPMSRFEELLLAIKNGETASGTPQSRIEEILSAIANGTLNDWLVGKNLFNEAKWQEKSVIDDKACLEFKGFYRRETGEKMGNPLLIAENLPQGTYTVSGKFKKTTLFNKLAVMNAQNERTEIGEFADNYEKDSITFTTTDMMKYLYVDTGGSEAKGYCEVESLKLEIGATATSYSPYWATSKLEEALIATADKLKGE